MQGRGSRATPRRGPRIDPRTTPAAVIAAGGRGSRFGGPPKQFLPLRGVPIVARSAARMLEAGCSQVVVAVPAGFEEEARRVLAGGIEIVSGGDTRSASVAAALAAVSADRVLVHDAARPLVTRVLIERVIAGLEEADAAIPGLAVSDTVKRVRDRVVAETVSRTDLWTVQTPQGFGADVLRRAHQQARDSASDDASLVEAMGGRVQVVEGDPRNIKITRREDLSLAEAILGAEEGAVSETRVGHGYDVHAFSEGGSVVLGGVEIPHERGLAGHSDADVVTHAICDALLGATSGGDIGQLFPATPEWAGASSLEMLRIVMDGLRASDWRVENIDVTVVAQAPKLADFIDAMRHRLADTASVPVDRISVKATTTDRLGALGREEGVAAEAVALVGRA